MHVESRAPRLANPAGPPVFSPLPEVMGVEITGRCSLRCKHCFNESGPGLRDELPLSVLERILDEAASWPLDSVRISGGEPTLHRDFKAVIAACASRGLHVTMNSNGIYSAEMLEWLKTAPIDVFLISIDGMEQRNDAIRGPGVFERATATCHALRAAGRPLTISFHAGAGSLPEIAPMAALAAEIGARLKISPIRPLGRAARELPPTPAWEFGEIIREVARLRTAHPTLRIMADFDVAGPDPAPGAPECCAAGRTMVNIGFDGGVYPCAFFVTPDAAFRAGSVYADSIANIWRDSPVFEAFRVRTKSRECGACRHYRMRCNGGCPAVSHFAGHCLDALDPTCPVGAGVLP